MNELQTEDKKIDIIETYLKFMNDKYLYSKQKVHLLFVEGYTDKVFYYDIFKEDSELKIDKWNICINFSSKDNHNKEWIWDFGNAYRKEKARSQEAKSIVEQTKGQFKNYDFVIASTYHNENMLKNNRSNNDNCKIDCFGFVDRDFGGKTDFNGEKLTFYKPRQLSQTTFHDRETSLIFYYLPKLYLLLKKDKSDAQNNDFIAKITDILYFATCQGLIEHYSIECSKSNMYVIAHENFRNLRKWKQYGSLSNFNFCKYLDVMCNEERLNSFGKAFLKADIADCKKIIEKIRKADVELEVKRWLHGLQDTEITDLLKEIFLNSNGHILCENIVEELKEYLGIEGTKEYELIDKFIPFIKEDSKYIKESSPLKEYIQYRKDLQNT